jgi:ABC-2 type transport system permease protein
MTAGGTGLEQPAVVTGAGKPTGRPNIFTRALQNPVILKELRGRMRGRRAFVFLTFYVVVVSLFISAIYSGMASQSSYGQSSPSFRQDTGKILFGSVVVFEFLMIGFIGPALTAGAFTSERERQTFDLLRTTLLSARSLVFGKLGAACMYLLLLLLTALPVEALAFLLGGVGMEELLVASLMLVVDTVFFCALGLLCSSLNKATLAATVSSYAAILLGILGLGLIVLVFTTTLPSSSFNPNNSSPLGFVILVGAWILAASNPFSAAGLSESFLIQDQTLFFVKVPWGSRTLFLVSPWILHIAIYVLLTALMIFLTVQFVKRPDR